MKVLTSMVKKTQTSQFWNFGRSEICDDTLLPRKSFESQMFEMSIPAFWESFSRKSKFPGSVHPRAWTWRPFQWDFFQGDAVGFRHVFKVIDIPKVAGKDVKKWRWQNGPLGYNSRAGNGWWKNVRKYYLISVFYPSESCGSTSRSLC